MLRKFFCVDIFDRKYYMIIIQRITKPLNENVQYKYILYIYAVEEFGKAISLIRKKEDA